MVQLRMNKLRLESLLYGVRYLDYFISHLCCHCRTKITSPSVLDILRFNTTYSISLVNDEVGRSVAGA
jgi:hypothetical protein